jgi:hypothetical protein
MLCYMPWYQINIHHLWQLSSKDSLTRDYIMFNDYKYCYDQEIKQ